MSCGLRFVEKTSDGRTDGRVYPRVQLRSSCSVTPLLHSVLLHLHHYATVSVGCRTWGPDAHAWMHSFKKQASKQQAFMDLERTLASR